ncbi:MAG: HDIG domain-containing protein [Synergistaceae bacterium]|jgi:putative nucleotidyltransferase with HDIG domain|nr:HDIG domain-containing protein [Synergistaceae bacterium]
MNSKNSNSGKYRRGIPAVRLSGEFLTHYVFPVLALLGAAVLIVVLQWRYIASSTSFTEGSPSPLTYYALSPLKFTDSSATNRLRTIAGESVVGVVVRDVSASDRMRTRLSEFRLLENRGAARDGGAAPFPPELTDAFKNLGESGRENLFLLAEQVGDAYFEAVKAGSHETDGNDRALLWQEIGKLELPVGEQNLLYQLLSEILDPGYKTDAQLTTAARDFARRSIPTVERKLNVGDVIVEQGNTVTPSLARVLRFQGYTERAFPLNQLLVACLLILLLPLWFEVSSGEPGARPSGYGEVTWSCVVFVVVTGWLCETAAAHLNVVGAGILPAVTMAYLCMPRRFAFIVSLGGITQGVFLIMGLTLYNTLFLLISGSVASLVGFCVLRRIDSREDLGYKVLALAVFLAVLKVIVRAYQGFPITWESVALRWPLGETWREIIRFLFFDLAATLFVTTLLPMIEKYIGALSVLKARELSHPSSPLLRKMQADVPGTYHHCLMIGTLAEAVAGELGMDENVMKMGAYYHDIGKLRRPRFFVENQMGGENIHDTMSPTLSAVAIIAHVREGLELANEFGLPKKVKQFISEHHGTTCLGYFYKKALANGENVDMGQFCYPGPKPRSRETALLMLLDSAEAAMRAESAKILTVNDIGEVIERVVAVKIREKQLDGVDFTYKEMTLIKAALLKAFQSMYHTRIVKEIK